MRAEAQRREQPAGNHIDVVCQALRRELMIEPGGDFAVGSIGDAKIDLERLLGFDEKVIMQELDRQFP